MKRNSAGKALIGGLCAIFLLAQEPAFAQEIYKIIFPAGAVSGLTGPIEFITIGEPLANSSTGVLSGFGFAYTVPAKVAVLQFVNTPAVAAAGADTFVSARVLDSIARPVKNTEVMFSRFSGAGLLETASARTGQDGIAVVVFKSAGAAVNTIQAQVFGLPPVSQKILWLVAPSGTLTGLPATDDGTQPHVLTLGNNISGNSWGKHWSPNDIIAFSSARREMNYSNGILFPQDIKIKISKKGWKKIKGSLIAVGTIVGVIGALSENPVLALIGAVIAKLGGNIRIDDNNDARKPRTDPNEEIDPPSTDPNIPNYCTDTPSLYTGYSANFIYTLNGFQSSSQNDIAGNTITQPPYKEILITKP